VKKVFEETTGKEKTTIRQDRTLVAGHAKGGREIGQPNFLSRYNSQSNRASGASVLPKVDVLTNGVGEGPSRGVGPNSKAEVLWIPHRGQPHMWQKLTRKGAGP